MITNITITNIKGFGTTGNSLDIELNPNKINIVVAPNGFGKTSLATAIRCLGNNSRRLIVDQDNKYQKDVTLNSSLSIKINGTTYVADNTRNDIGKVLNSIVINSRISANVSTKRIGTFTRSKGYVDIDDIVVTKIVSKPTFKYKISEL